MRVDLIDRHPADPITPNAEHTTVLLFSGQMSADITRVRADMRQRDSAASRSPWSGAIGDAFRPILLRTRLQLPGFWACEAATRSSYRFDGRTNNATVYFNGKQWREVTNTNPVILQPDSGRKSALRTQAPCRDYYFVLSATKKKLVARHTR